eukprot:TRINITY_DN3339_c0_g1_i8.p1 TRINITY_DN3339_c0_g1~~TRINITY_DN3339_c0_g1_i8.p1  ORF type:complete len:895 (-),score=415.91 TRINITY_DN3339_c0_g1_i8:92-2776(-)
MARFTGLIMLLTFVAGVDAYKSAVQEQVQLGEMQESESSWTLAHDKKIALEALGVVLALLLFSALGWMWQNTPGSSFGEKKEVLVDEELAVPLMTEVKQESGKPAPAVAEVVAPAATASAVIVEEAAPVEAPQDYEEMVRGMLKKAQDELGSKFEQGSEVQNILQNKAETFADKAKALVLNEINDTCGSVARIMEQEEFMMMLDWDATVASNFPPPSVLLAGLLVPTNLALAFCCHLIQIFLVLLPVALVTGYAIAKDYDQPCPSIAGLKPWAIATVTLAVAILLSRLAMMFRIYKAQMDLHFKSAEMKAKLAAAEQSGSSFGNLQELFLCHSSCLQYAVVCEARCRIGTAAHIVGGGSAVWLLLTGYNMYLYFYYMFVPGVVAFHEAAKGQDDYCGAVVIACAAKFGVLITTLFFMVNIMTVFFWIFDTTLNTDAIAQKIAAAAKSFDRANMGIPVAQLLVKAFVLRGSSEVLCARLSVTMREKNVLAKEFAETEARLLALNQRFNSKALEVEKMEERIVQTNGGTLESQAESLKTGLDMEALKHKGMELCEAAKTHVAGAEEAVTDEIEKLVKKFEELVQQVTDSEEFKAAKAKAEEGVEQAKIAAEQAQEQAKVLAAQAEEQAKVVAAQAEQKAKEAAAQAQEVAAKAQEEGAKLAAQAQEEAKKAAAQAEEQVEAAAAEAQEEAKKAAAQAEEQAKAAAAKVEEEAKKAAEEAKKTAAQAEEQAKAAAAKVEEEAKKAAAQAEEQAKVAAAKVEEEAKKAAAQAEEQAKVAAAKVEEEAKKAAAQAEEQGKAAAATVEEEAKKAAAQAEEQSKAAAATVEKEAKKAAAQAEEQAKAAAAKVEEEAKKAAEEAKKTAAQAEEQAKAAAAKVEEEAKKAVEEGIKKAKKGRK